MKRSRAVYAVATGAVIALGLASRASPALFPAIFGKYPGDALWALMVFTSLGTIMPAIGTARLGMLALLVSYLDELSQLYQAPWIRAIRATTPGHLVLGSDFSWFDLIAYTVGIAFGVLCEALWRAIARRRQARISKATASAAMPSSRPR